MLLFSLYNTINFFKYCLKEALEAAWDEGFDTAGREQLGGKIVNTR